LDKIDKGFVTVTLNTVINSIVSFYKFNKL
jgi:hypothetical protein